MVVYFIIIGVYIMNMIALLIFPFFMAYAASSDFLTMRISNKISLGLIISFFILSVFVDMSLNQFAMHIGVSLLVLVVTFALFSFGWIGGGDAKLAASTVLWFGSSETLLYLIYASIIGGILTIIILLLRKFPLPFGFDKIAWIKRLHTAGTGVPYGIALAIAGLLVYPETIIFSHFIK